MADETKLEASEAERLLEGLDAEQDGNENGEEVSVVSPVGEKQQEVKGSWTTSLPKRFREEAKGYASLESYLDSLRSAKQEEPKAETDEDWESAASSLGASDSEAEKAILRAMREQGLRTDKAKEVYSAIQKEVLAENARAISSRKDKVSEYFTVMRSSEKNFDAVMKNGLRAINRNDHDAFVDARERGVFDDPAVLRIVHMIGSRETEFASASAGAPKSEERRQDPLNPYGF